MFLIGIVLKIPLTKESTEKSKLKVHIQEIVILNKTEQNKTTFLIYLPRKSYTENKTVEEKSLHQDSK